MADKSVELLRIAVSDACRVVGVKNALAEFLLSAKIIDKEAVGQLVANINCGGVRDVFVNRKVV